MTATITTSHSHTVHHLNWIGVALGLAIHTLIDGIALGASVRAELGEPVFLSLFGLGHVSRRPSSQTLGCDLDHVADGGGGLVGRGAELAVNFGFAMMCPLGALLFVLGVDQFSMPSSTL
jgi:zinc and cadmium transporter